jgi:hypothetical protein
MNVPISLIGIAASIKDDAALGKVIGSLFCDCESPAHVQEHLHVLIREFRALGGRENYVELLDAMATSIKDFADGRSKRSDF